MRVINKRNLLTPMPNPVLECACNTNISIKEKQSSLSHVSSFNCILVKAELLQLKTHKKTEKYELAS